MSEAQNEPQINVQPTKAFFVDMLTRDIALEQAVLDLVDNSIDAAKAMKANGSHSLGDRRITIEFGKDRFRILDNCGGFDRKTAASYAFRFGRPPGMPRTPHSIGQFGVGMKRALFKFGNRFSVRSATESETWAVEINVPDWEQKDEWSFPWGDFKEDENISTATPGTEIIAEALRPEVSARFSTQNFENAVVGLLQSKHRQFISEGVQISVNGKFVSASSLYMLVGDSFRPGSDQIIFQEQGKADVRVSIIVGVGQSSPREAGWYVVCNGRVILEADRRPVTGWGLIEEQSNKLTMPSYHNQFARFRGIVSFDSDDSALIPWTTTKTDIDQDSHIWQKTFGRMIEMMRPVIDFLNELNSDIEENTREESPLLDFVSKTNVVKTENLSPSASFTAPARASVVKGPKTVKIQYSKPVEHVNFLMEELSLTSAKAVGTKTFELIFDRMGGK
jgi:hypothetical protein